MLSGLRDLGSVALAAAAAAATLAAGFGVFAYLLTRSWSLRLVVTAIYVHRLRGAGAAPELSRVALARAGWDAVGRRLGGEERTAADELELLAHAAGVGALPAASSWGPVDDASEGRIAAYTAILAALKRSLVLRLAASAEVRERELALASRVLAVLVDDRDHVFEPPHEDGGDPLDPIFVNELGTTLLVPPPQTLAGSYRDVRVAFTGRHFGIPAEPFESVLERAKAKGGRTGWCWTKAEASADPCSHLECIQIDAHALYRAAEAQERGWFNGTVVRVRGWAAARSRSSSSRRLVLYADPTSFLTALVTSEGFASYAQVPADDVPPAARAFLDRRDATIDDFGGLRARLRGQALDRVEPGAAKLANLLGVHTAIVTADRRVVIVRRGRVAWVGGGKLNTAANGAVELGERVGLREGDFDEDGLVDVVGGALREVREELGDLELNREATVVRALTLTTYPATGDAGHVSPVVILEARTPLEFAQIPRRQFVTASRTEGAHEVGEEFYGLSLRRPQLAESVRWLRNRYDAADITPGGVITSILAMLHFASPEEIAGWWTDGVRSPDPVDLERDPGASVVRVAAGG